MYVCCNKQVALNDQGMPSFVSCSRLTWVLSMASLLIVVLGVVLVKCGVTVYILKGWD